MRFLAKLLSAVIPLSIMISAPTQARDWSVIEKSGTLIAATEGAFAPFNYYEGTKLTGYEVDVAEALAKKLGLKIEWHAVPFDAEIPAINQDRYDFAIASHGYTEERAKAVDFASPHYCTGGQIAAASDGPMTAEALKGKTVGVQLATSYASEAKKIPGIKAVKTYKSDPDVFAALKAKKIDAWISDKFVVLETLKKNPDSKIVTGDLVFQERVSLITRKGNTEFLSKVNAALAELIKDGTIPAISKKYFDQDVTCK